MVVLVIGGSGSGKSEYAEELIVSLGERKQIYIATMKPWDAECERRIERHRRLRQGKGFQTVECFRNLKELKGDWPSDQSAALLECMSNLVSNEMFGTELGAPILDEWHTVKQVLEGIYCLKERVRDLVLVSNEVFSDGEAYSPETNRYRRALGQINQEAARIADVVVEVVAGIPVFIKGKVFY